VFIPFGDHPNPPKPQWVTRILLGLNIAVHLFITMPLQSEALTEADWLDPSNKEAFKELVGHSPGVDPRRLESDTVYRRAWLASVPGYRLFTQKYGYKPGRPGLLSLLTCMFLHGDFWHLAGNMLFLWIFGDNVEWRLGRRRYVVAYLVTGVVATVSFAMLAGNSVVPLVGASGAIFGVLGLYLIWFPHNQVRVIVFLLFIFVIHVRAIWVLLAYLVVGTLWPILAQRGPVGGGGVAHVAHLGGFAAGVIGALLWNRLKGSVPAPRPAPHLKRKRAPWAAAPQVPLDDPATSFKSSLLAGRMEDAAHGFSRLVREGGSPPEAADVFTLGRWLYDSGFIPDTAAVFRYYIKTFARGDDLDRVHLGLGILLARRMGEPAAAREHLLVTLDLTDDAAVTATAKAELERLE